VRCHRAACRDADWGRLTEAVRTAADFLLRTRIDPISVALGKLVRVERTPKWQADFIETCRMTAVTRCRKVFR
jgi:hypothetical protein